MKFLKENKVFLAIIVGALIVGAAIYFSPKPVQKPLENQMPTGNVANIAKECPNIPELADSALRLATKIIDGDTFLIEGGFSVRILGIDADERDHPCYDAAKNRLEELILNKEIRLEKGREDKDQYCRYLRYVFLPASAEASADKDNENIALKLVEDGLAVARFSPEDVKYREEISTAEKTAKENKVGCKWSSIAEAVKEESEKIEFQWEKLTPEITGLKVIGACQAGNYYGKEMIVEGKIVGTFRSKTNTVFFNFEKSYPNQCFTAVIFSLKQYKFVSGPEKYYANKTVRIRGEIKEYQGKPEIILENSSQIETGK